MSLFDYPRFNFKGTLQLNPGTANNDDYAQQPSVVLPPSYGPYAGQPLALIDSKTVRAQTYGMSDKDFIVWAQKAQTFIDTSKNKETHLIPAEWNYYGAMDSNIISATVVGVQTGPGQVCTEASPGDPATAVIGASVSYSGYITDVNSEGSPPGTQFFIDSLTLQSSANQQFLAGSTSKGACQWLNFYRNVNLTADGGSGGYVYHVIRKSDKGAVVQLPGFEDPKIVGVICRYYLYERAGGASGSALEALYQQQLTNPATLQIIGTFAPLFADERIFTGPVGRLLVWNDAPQIPTQPGRKNNSPNGMVALAPAVLRPNGNIISADFSGAFPEDFQPTTGDNPKFPLGTVSLMVASAAESAIVGTVDYLDVTSGDSRGWIFDFDISANEAARRILLDPDASFSLSSDEYKTLLVESDYYFVSNQQAIYAEQHGVGDSFLNQGATGPATVSVYHRGRELTAADCPPITVWQYRSVPIQSPGDVETNATNFKPGQHLRIDTSQPGDFLFTFSVGAQTNFPPQSYNNYMFPPYLTNAPAITLRILPNDEEFSAYYVDPKAEEPVGNDQLTFDIVYEKVLRTYYLLYPAMNLVFKLNCEKEVKPKARDILRVTDPGQWMSGSYMPRTRDLSNSRRTLLQAWCRKVLAAPATT